MRSEGSRFKVLDGVAGASPEETAAIITAITAYLGTEPEESNARLDRWSLAGRLEASGLRVDRATLRGGWRLGR